MGSIEDGWDSVTGAGSGTWLAWAAWLALLLAIVVVIYLGRQLRRSHRLAVERTRPHVTMFMEPNAADWHVVELVVRNFGQTPAYDIRFEFAQPPTVARYETAADGYADVVAVQLPPQLPVLAPDQEWRTVWDSAIDRTELGGAIGSRFTGVVAYYDRPERPRGWRPWRRQRPRFENRVVLDWRDLPPVQRVELMTTHDLAKREKQKLELLRGLLTYFHYACQETRPDVLRGEIDRVNRTVRETKDRLQSREAPANDAPSTLSTVNTVNTVNTEATVRLDGGTSVAGKHQS